MFVFIYVSFGKRLTLVPEFCQAFYKYANGSVMEKYQILYYFALFVSHFVQYAWGREEKFEY